MRASWSALHTSLIRTLNLRSSQADFQMMRQACRELAEVGSIPSLLERQHARDADPVARFAVIRALVTAAQSGQRYRSTAHLMVIVALWPGLEAVLWRLARGFPDARDDLPAEIVARIGEAVLTLDLDRVTTVTATLLRNLERDIRRSLIADRQVVEVLRPIDDPAVDALAAAGSWTAEDDGQSMAAHLVGLSRRDANLLTRVFLIGETQEEAGRALGLEPAAARKRFQRAVAKLRSRKKLRLTCPIPARAVGL